MARKRSARPIPPGQRAFLEPHVVALIGAFAATSACARDFAKANDTDNDGSQDASALDGGELAGPSTAASFLDLTEAAALSTTSPNLESSSFDEPTGLSTSSPSAGPSWVDNPSTPLTTSHDSESSSFDEPLASSATSGPSTSTDETFTEQQTSMAVRESASPSSGHVGTSTVEAEPPDASVASPDAGDGSTNNSSPTHCAKTAPDGGLDTDGDAEADVDDDDDDDDGIPDAEDADPLDPTVPGGSDACGPAVVINDPCMRQALEATKELVDIPVHLEHCGLDISGYYLRPDLSGEFVADNNGSPRGVLVGGEYRFTQTGELVQVAEVAFTNGVATGHSKSSWPTWVRGSRRGYSTLGCNPSSVGISSGRRREDGGIADVWTLSVARAPMGSNVCPENNSWILSFQSVLLRVAAHELDYMCSADGAAYVPSETWNSESGVCTCQDDLDVLCSHN